MPLQLLKRFVVQTRWLIFFFFSVTLFKYFINLFYPFHRLSFPFLKGMQTRERAHHARCVFPFIKKKKKKMKKILIYLQLDYCGLYFIYLKYSRYGELTTVILCFYGVFLRYLIDEFPLHFTIKSAEWNAEIKQDVALFILFF